MNEKDRVNFLENKLEYLSQEKHSTLKALENVIEVDDLSTSLNKLKNTDIIIERAYRKLSELLKIKCAGFMLVDENSGLFSRSGSTRKTAVMTLWQRRTSLLWTVHLRLL